MNLKAVGIVLVSLTALCHAGPPATTAVDQALQKVKSGTALTEADRESCNQAFTAFHEYLSEKNGTGINYEYSAADRVEFFIVALKMSIIDPEDHGGWPFRSTLRTMVLEGLKKKAEAENDPFLVFCTIFPALDAGDQAYALKSYQKLLKADPFLAGKAWLWLRHDRSHAARNDQMLQAIDESTAPADSPPPSFAPAGSR